MTKTENGTVPVPVITSIDAYPGAGKTHYFKMKALEMLRAEKPSHVLVYAAPTKALCKEVYDWLVEKLEADGHPELKAKIHKVWISDKKKSLDEFKRFFKSHNKDATADNDPRTVSEELNLLLGILPAVRDVSSEVTRDARNKLFEDIVANAALEGSIILTTHACFNLVRYRPCARPVWIFFDEARQCLGLRQSLRLNRALAIPILWTLRLEWFKVEKSKLKEKSKLAMITNFPSKDSIDSAIKQNNVMLRNSLDEDAYYKLINRSDQSKLIKIIQGVNPERTDLFILAPNEEEFLKNISSSTPRHLFERDVHANYKTEDNLVLYPFHRPSGLFHFYDRVTIMSAFFTDSQMFHSLKDQYQIVSLIQKDLKNQSVFEENPWMQQAWTECKSVRQRDKKIKDNTVSRLVVTPLLTTSHDYDAHAYISENVPSQAKAKEIFEMTTWERLSKHLLASGMIVKQSFIPRILDLVEKAELPWSGWDTVRHVWEYWYVMERSYPLGERPPCDEDQRKEFIRANPPHVLKMLEFLLSKLRPFMFRDVEKSKGIIFPALQLAMLAKNHLVNLGVKEKAMLVMNSPNGDLISYMPNLRNVIWKTPLVKDTITSIKDRFYDDFIIPESTKLHGLNSWQHIHHFVHLAAMNPSPEIQSIFTKVLPEYNVSADFLLENLIQTLYRTSLRNPKLTAKDKVHLYVTHAGVAKALAMKLDLDLTISNNTRTINTSDLCELRFYSKTKQKVRREKIKVSRTLYSAETKVRVHRLRTQISKLKKRTDTTSQNTVKDLQEQIARLKAISVNNKTKGKHQ